MSSYEASWARDSCCRLAGRAARGMVKSGYELCVWWWWWCWCWWLLRVVVVARAIAKCAGGRDRLLIAGSCLQRDLERAESRGERRIGGIHSCRGRATKERRRATSSKSTWVVCVGVSERASSECESPTDPDRVGGSGGRRTMMDGFQSGCQVRPPSFMAAG